MANGRAKLWLLLAFCFALAVLTAYLISLARQDIAWGVID